MKTHYPFLSVLVFIFFFTAPDITFSQMYWNQACFFAGNSASYVRVQNSSSIDLTGSFTIEAWVNPASLSGASKGIIAKGSSLGTSLKYAIRLNTSGRFSVITNGAQRLISRSSSAVTINNWNHISATYDSSANLFSIYINGVLDTTAAVAGGAPAANSDSLFIGISGASTPFNGQLDEVRIWNRDLSADEVNRYMRTSLCTSSGVYNGLGLSMTFQRQSNITPFTADDFSGNGNSGIPRNVTAKDQTHQPYHTIDQNESAELDGTDDYLAGKDDLSFFPTDDILFECWYYPRDGNMSTLIRKASGAVTAFSVSVSSASMKVIINDAPRILHVGSPLSQWSHIAIVYSNQSDEIEYYQNGTYRGSIPYNSGSIPSSTDSFYIGGSAGSTECFNGFIDEVRITGREFSDREIDFRLFKSLEASDDTEPGIKNVCYNLDGNTFDNGEDDGPVLYFKNDARFSHPAQTPGQPRSPLLNTESDDYHKAFYFKPANTRIPASGTEGTITNSQATYLDYTISDIDVFVHLNHQNISNIVITIFKNSSPDSLIIFDGSITNSSDNNLSLMFDDQSDSSLNNNYSSFCSAIKPLNNMNSFFSGKNTKGDWSIRVRDKTSGDIGRLYGWGIRFNNMTTPEFNFGFIFLLQGFYNAESNALIPDTIFTYLREIEVPYNIVSSSKALYHTSGSATLSFGNINYLQEYYLQVGHRNTIETWAASKLRFTELTPFYRFDVTDTTVFGNNELIVDTSPVRYGMYSGDVNQDGTIDLTDGSLIDNDAFNFNSGYLPTDTNGDGIIDVADAVFADNNSFNFVGKITP
ncbi:MAG: proprotein convertase P-domain-containing protein [Ignavibacteria bacterium]|nr:proprotein convertase P-domain-containing protein [Ignavibacteria bacterium]